MMRFGRIETKKPKHMYKNVPNDCGDTLEREKKRERARKIEGEEERDCICVCVCDIPVHFVLIKLEQERRCS